MTKKKHQESADASSSGGACSSIGRRPMNPRFSRGSIAAVSLCGHHQPSAELGMRPSSTGEAIVAKNAEFYTTDEAAEDPRGERVFSKDGSPHVTDERFNTASHLAAAILSLLGIVLLVVYSSMEGKVWHIVSFSIYGFALLNLFLSSTLHHGIEGSRGVEEFLRSLDYFAIFILIAGTFTPFCLVVLRGPLGWSVFGVNWSLAVIGILLKALFPKTPKWVFLTLYATMGWLGAAVAIPLVDVLPWSATALVILGGVAYTGGAIIFSVEKPNPAPGLFGFHEIWHIAVILGALCHFLCMYLYVLPT